MADEKDKIEFDVDGIKNGEFMTAKDRRYFERYGSAMEEQAEIIKENLDEYMAYAEQVYDSVLKSLSADMKRYLVQGACLKCSKQLEAGNIQKLVYEGSKIDSKADDVEKNSMLQILAARTENANGLPFANVTDTRGGLSGELLKGGAKEGKEEENQLNIISFGNCGFLDEDGINDVDKIAERVLQILCSHSYLGDKCRQNGITKDRILKGILEGIKSGKGTCYGCMVLNSEWENLPEEYDYVENTFDPVPGAAGIEGFLEGKQYFQFGGKEAINMMSMLFCRFGGGIINAVDSGQSTVTQEDIFTDLEKTLLEKFGHFAYEEWNEDKKRCAEEIWNKFYVEGGYDACFVAGLIGNMYGEGQCGLLQNMNGWGNFLDENGNAVCVKNTCITNVNQARVACLNAPSGYGIGMIQWSFSSRKKNLFECYQEHAENGILTSEQLMAAEIEYMYVELADIGEVHDFKHIIPMSENYASTNNINDSVTYATSILFRDYLRPESFTDVTESEYTVVEEKWKEAQEAKQEKEIPSIIRRIIASKVAYEEFMR